MPTLNWIGKAAVVEHHKEVPFRLLKCRDDISVGDPQAGNLLVQGDNLEALKALLPYYAGQVKCIYIDPPYNTGKENWIYNDAVNSPEIKEWLGNVVGKEAEDLSRHDKWLCLMYPRLLLAKEFLADDGVIFISIDDNELHSLRTIMDELFKQSNMISCFVWQTEGNFDNQAKVKIAHEYILAYAKDITKFPAPAIIDPNIPEDSKLFRDDIKNTIVKNGPKNPISSILLPKDFPADFESGIIKARTNAWPHFENDLIVRNYKLVNAEFVTSGWSSKRIFENFIKSNFESVLDTKGQNTVFRLTKNGAIEAIKVRSDEQSHVISVLRNMGSTQQMSATLANMGIKFDYPKPLGLLDYFLSLIKGKDYIVLDFFAGSGTTGHAVLAQNSADGGSRRFIMVELEKNIATNITAERLKLIIRGYQDTKGLGSGFRFCELGATLFDPTGQIRLEVKYEDLAQHIHFIETGSPLPRVEKPQYPLLGVQNGLAIYLLYNGVLKDKSPHGGNVLTYELLETLPPHDGQKVIYGNGCRIGEQRLRDLGIVFKQIPYEIREK